MGTPIFYARIRELLHVSPTLAGKKRVFPLTFSALSWVFGFLWLMRFFKERMASFGCTVLERMTSDISRLRAMSSL